MLRGFILSLILTVSSFAYAQRNLPDDMDVAVLKKVELPYLKVNQGGFSWVRLLTLGIAKGNNTTLQITRFTRIHDENDRFIPMGRLPAQAGKSIAFKHNDAGLVREIWILTEAESEKFTHIKEAQKEAAQ